MPWLNISNRIGIGAYIKYHLRCILMSVLIVWGDMLFWLDYLRSLDYLLYFLYGVSFTVFLKNFSMHFIVALLASF